MINRTNVYSIIDFGTLGNSTLWENTVSYLPVRSMYVLKCLNRSFHVNAERFRNEAVLLQLEQMRSLDINDLIYYSKHVSLKELEADEKDKGSSRVSNLIRHCRNLEVFTIKVVNLWDIKRHFNPCDPGSEDAESKIEKIIQEVAKLPKLRIFEATEIRSSSYDNNYFQSNEIKALSSSKSLEQMTLYNCIPTDPDHRADVYTYKPLVTSMDEFYKMGNLRRFSIASFQFKYGDCRYAPIFDNEHVKKISGLKHLHTLNLQRWEKITLGALESLAEIRNITHLTLPNDRTSLTNETLQATNKHYSFAGAYYF